MTTIHEPVAIHPGVVFGANCVVWQFTSILEGTVIGDDCVIGSGVWIGRGVRIGNGVHIQDKCHISGGAVLEDDVFLGPMVVTTDDKHPRVRNPDYLRQPPVIRKGAALGAGVVLCPGVEIGAGALVAAGAVVTRDILPGGTAIGVPARLKLAMETMA